MMQMVIALAAVVIVPVGVAKWTQWYSKRCADQAKSKLCETLEHFQAIANTYTENGTPEELQRLIEDLEELMEELNEPSHNSDKFHQSD
jgi:ABC-type transport system involved in cytochrome bd biosynthesis fused ATPase/permease subunit